MHAICGQHYLSVASATHSCSTHGTTAHDICQYTVCNLYLSAILPTKLSHWLLHIL